MSSLYELTGDFLQVKEMMESGEYDQETLQNTMDCIQCSIEEKAENIVKIMKEKDGQALVYKTEIERMATNKQAVENDVKRLKDMLKTTMDVAELKKIVTPLFKISIAKNGGALPIEILGDVPDEYKTTPTPVPDKTKIKELLGAGDVAWAKFRERGESLRIK